MAHTTTTEREAVARAFEAAARLARKYTDEQVPLAPPSWGSPLDVKLTAGTDEEKRAKVDAVAKILAADPEITGVRTGKSLARIYGVTCWLGEGVAYRVTALLSQPDNPRARALAAVGSAAA